VVGPDRVAGAQWHKQRCWPATLSCSNMAPQPSDHSLEALSNLLYLIRRSLDDPAKTKTYLDIDIAATQSFRRVGSPGADNL
jgi:hypothetical protein